MSSDRFEARREKLVRKLADATADAAADAAADALFVANETNVSYLTGFSGDSSYLLIGRDLTMLVSDSRYTSQIHEECPGLDVKIRTSKQTTLQAAARVLKQTKWSKLGFESHATTVDQWQTLGEATKFLELVPIAGLVENLRMIKDAYEVSEIRRAIRQAERGFDVVRASLTGQVTERQLAHELENAMRRFGAERASFHPIVAVGDRSALPHARPGHLALQTADLALLDWGAEAPSGYRSDLTRVLVTGRIFPKLRKIYEVVLTAQRLAIDAIRPKAECRAVDAVARDFIQKSGYGKRFGHGLGHGIGLDIHEGPRFSPISTDRLSPGMVVTVEPGVYLPGWGGIRIEDDVLVTRDGCEVLTSLPKELDHALIELPCDAFPGT